MVRLAKPGEFCPNKECPDYQKLQSQSQRNIIKAGKTKAGAQWNLDGAILTAKARCVWLSGLWQDLISKRSLLPLAI